MAEVLEGTTLALGPRGTALEAAFRERLGVDAALVSSGTAGLYLALRAVGVDGGNVITPSYGFVFRSGGRTAPRLRNGGSGGTRSRIAVGRPKMI